VTRQGATLGGGIPIRRISVKIISSIKIFLLIVYLQHSKPESHTMFVMSLSSILKVISTWWYA